MEKQYQDSKTLYHSVSNPSAEFSNDETTRHSPEFHRMLFANEGSRESERSYRRHLAWWLPEVLSLLLGAACLTFIIAVLVHADDKPPPRWPLNVTINTFLAFFTSLAKVAYMLPIVAGLGQLKWMWFMSRPRSLVDFQVFDEASRGAWGCIRLIVTFKGFLTCLGALVTLSSLFTSTITQQAVDFRERKAESSNGTAEVPRATIFSFYNGSHQVIAPYDTHREKHALLDGAFFVPIETLEYATPTCSSGDCEWNLYGTLAVCTDIVNLTATTNQTYLDSLHNTTMTTFRQLFNATLSSRNHIAYGSVVLPSMPPVYPIIMFSTKGPTGAFNQSVNELIIDDHIIAYSEALTTNESLETTKFLFLEHVAYWCTKTLSTSVRDGQATTTERESRAKAVNTSRYPFNFAWSPDFAACYFAGTCNATLGGITVELEPATPETDAHEQDKYVVDIWSSLISSALVTEAMYGGVLLDSTRGFVSTSGGSVPQAIAISLFGDFLETGVPPAETQMGNLRGVSRNMARSLTNLLRQLPIQTFFNPLNASTTHAGTVLAPQTYIKIRWPWLSMLAAQLLLTLVFLVATMASTRSCGVQILKGSSLATMCGLDKSTRRHLGDINDLRRLEKRAEDVKVRLERGTSGAALWLAMEGGGRPVTWQPVPSWSSEGLNRREA